MQTPVIQAAAVPEAPQAREIGAKTMASTLIGSHSLTHVYGQGFQVIIPEIYLAMGLSPFQTAFIGSVQTLSSGAASLVVGFVTDMMQHRRGMLLAVSMVILGAGYGLASIAPVYGLLLVAVAFGSVGISLWHPPAVSLLSQRFPQQRGFMISMHRSLGNIGDTIGPVIVGALITYAAFSWQSVLQMGAPIALALGLLVFLLLRNVGGAKQAPQDRTDLKTQLSSLKRAFKNPGMVTLIAITGLRGMGDRAVLFFLPLYLRFDLDMSSFDVGWRLGLLTALGVITGPLIGALSDRVGRKQVIIAVMLIGGIVPLLIMPAGSGIALVAVLLFGGMFMYSVNSLVQAAALDIVEGQRLEGTFIGLSWGFNSLFNGLSPLIAGALAQVFGFGVAFYYGAVLILAGGLLATRLPELKGRRAAHA